MKICLSRKGFDSQYGGMPSPILPDGRLVSFPIPSRHDRSCMKDVNAPDIPLNDLLFDLSRGQWSRHSTVHLDPDLNRYPSSRDEGWRPAFGQTGAAQSHLVDQGFGVGDLFLFFGWFRQVELLNGRWRYVRSAPNLHLIFGWLEVGEILSVVTERRSSLARHPWIKSHPHVASPKHYTDTRNCLYVASESSRYSKKAQFGAGQFPYYRDALRLTAAGSRNRSTWALPEWFFPEDRPALTYHSKLDRWSPFNGGVNLRSVAKGQEFVLNAAYYPEAPIWAGKLIRSGVL